MNKAIKRYSRKASAMRNRQPQLRRLSNLKGVKPVFFEGIWRLPKSIRTTLPR